MVAIGENTGFQKMYLLLNCLVEHDARIKNHTNEDTF